MTWHQFLRKVNRLPCTVYRVLVCLYDSPLHIPLPIYISIYLSTYLPTYIPTDLPNLSIYLSICLPIYLPSYLFTYLHFSLTCDYLILIFQHFLSLISSSPHCLFIYNFIYNTFLPPSLSTVTTGALQKKRAATAMNDRYPIQ